MHTIYMDIKLRSQSSMSTCNEKYKLILFLNQKHFVKSVRMDIIFGPYITVFGLNTGKYAVNFWSVFFCIPSKSRKIRARNNSVFGQFSCSGRCVGTYGCRLSIKTYYIGRKSIMEGLIH